MWAVKFGREKMRKHKWYRVLCQALLRSRFVLGLTVAAAAPLLSHAQTAFLDTQLQISSSTLSSPRGIATDTAGNLYVADSGNNRIVKIPVSASGFGTTQTLIGDLSNPAAVVIDWYGNLYISDSGNNRILKLAFISGSYQPPATIASNLNNPGGLAFDSAGNLFVADTGNNRVIKLPVLGSGFGAPLAYGSGLSAPAGVAIDVANNLYVADTGNNRVIKMTYASAYVTQQVYFASITSPTGIFVDASYDVFITSPTRPGIFEEPWNAGANRFNAQIAHGSGWSRPVGISTDTHGNIYVVDTTATQVWEIPAATPVYPATPVGSVAPEQIYNFTLAAGATISGISIMMQGISGQDYVDGGQSTCTPQTYTVATICSVQVLFKPGGSGLRTGAITLFDSQGNPLVTAYLAGKGIGPEIALLPASQTSLGAGLSGPSGVAVDGAGNIYISDTGNNRILEIPCINGSYGSEITLPVNQINGPMGLTIDGAGNLYIASNGNDKILKLPHTNSGFGPQIKVPIAVYAPSGVSVDSFGSLYIADTFDNKITKMPWTGIAYSAAQMIGSYAKMPTAVSADIAGNVFFTMYYLNSLAEVPLLSAKYQPQRTIVNTQISSPTGVVIDGNSNLYLLDSGNNRVILYPFAGSAYGTPITVASGFNTPTGLAIDSSNNLYVADTGNNRIVKINFGYAAPKNFLNTYVGITSSDSAQHVVVQNVGNIPVALAELTYPIDFPEAAVSTSTCAPGDSLVVGAGCSLAIDFTPRSVGYLNESLDLTVTDSQDDWSASVSLSGTGLARQAQAIVFPQLANTVYGSAAINLQATATSGLPVTFQVVSGPAVLSSNGRTLGIKGVGTIVVTAYQAGNTTYQPASPVTISFSVAPAILMVTSSNATAVYGAIPKTFSYTFTGFVSGQSAAQVITGQPTITPEGGAVAKVGVHILTPSVGTLQAANYTFAFTSATLTVKPAVLQIMAQPASMIYGSSLPKFTWIAKGFVNADTSSILMGTPAFATSASSRSAVGAYTVTPSIGTLEAINYTFSYASATLTVTAAILTVTAQNQSMVYGSFLPNMAYTVTGFAGQDTIVSVLSGVPAFTTTAGSHAKVGQYAIVPSLGTLKAINYKLSFVNGAITIVPAPLLVTPATVTITYGQNIPALKNLQLVGLVNSDTAATSLTGAPILTTSASSATSPGNVAITIQKGTLSSANYTINLQPGVLVITKASLTVTPASVSRIYGVSNPPIGYTITGFVNGDTAARLSGIPAITTTASVSSVVGKYSVTASAGTLSSSNYSFTFSSGTLTVNKAPLTITANSLSITYGNTTPSLTSTIKGFVNGDTSSALTGTVILSSTTAAVPSVGSYPISIDASRLSAKNYTFTAVAGTLTVSKASATIAANNLSITVGNSPPTLTYTVSGLVNKDQASAAVTGAPALTTAAAKSSPVGAYPITIGVGTMTSKNYNIKLLNGTLTITQSAASVVIPNPVTPRLPNKRLP